MDGLPAHRLVHLGADAARRTQRVLRNGKRRARPLTELRMD